MTDDKKKMTAQGSSVGADDGQSISQNSKTTIPDPDEKSNSPERDLEELYRKMRRMSDPAYLHTVTLDELMDNVFEGKSAVIENLLYTGAYILAGAPKIGKSFLVAQIAHHVSSGQDLWGYKVHQGTVLYLALEDDESRLQRRMFRMFGVEGTSSLHFATSAKMIGGGLDEQLEKFVREHSDTKLIIVFRIVVTPAAVIVLADFAGRELVRLLFPSVKHFQELVCLFTFIFADFQTNLPVRFTDGQPINIFKGKQGVHETDLTVNVRNIKSLRGNIKHLCQCSR